MIEAWWRWLKHQWLFLHSLDSATNVRRLVAFYVDEHNRVLPYSAFQGQTPNEMYFGTGDAVPANLTARAAGHALKPTDRHGARHAHQSTRPRDDGVLRPVRRNPALASFGPRDYAELVSGGGKGRALR